MRAVRRSDYKEFGCVNCGCDFCYTEGMQGPSTPVICGECNTKFIVMNDNLKMSAIGVSKDEYDGLILKVDYNDNSLLFDDISIEQLVRKMQNGDPLIEMFDKINKKGVGIEIDGYIYPLPSSHPRKGTPKHKFVRPDIRPENGIGDFCNPRGIGGDLACFVKSKEAGQRITDMINKINKEYDNKGFSCWLDYRESEPLWIQVKIDYPDEIRAIILSSLIHENDNVITEDIVRKAMDMKMDFANYWKYKAKSKVFNAVDTEFLHDIIGRPEELSQEERDAAYKKAFQHNNYLDQFEVWGAYKQINLELEKGNTEKAATIARHLIELNGDHFNYELMLQRGKQKSYITNLRRYFHEELVNAINIYYEDTKQSDKKTDGEQVCDYDYIRDYANISNDAKQQFVSDWQSIAPKLFEVIDVELLRKATEPTYKKDKDEIAKLDQKLSEYPNLYAMFSLFGLYTQISRNIEEDQIETAVLALQHVASQLNSPLFEQFKIETKNNDIHSLMTQTVYAQLFNMASKYYGKRNEIGSLKKIQ